MAQDPRIKKARRIARETEEEIAAVMADTSENRSTRLTRAYRTGHAAFLRISEVLKAPPAK